jgi:uncharacterized protein involved in exopolysaccharide biosynthesis
VNDRRGAAARLCPDPALDVDTHYKIRPSGNVTVLPFVEARGAPPRSLRRVVAAVYRQGGLITLCVLAGAAVSLMLHAGQPTVYTSTAKVRVQTQQPVSPSGVAAGRETPDSLAGKRDIDAEIELMKTRSSAQAVVARYAIGDTQLVDGDPGLRWRAAAGGQDDRSKTVDLLLAGITVQPQRSKAADASAEVLEVRFECTDPALAPVALQSILDHYLQLGAQQSRRLGEAAAQGMATELAQAADELRQSEDGIVALALQQSGRRAADSGSLKLDLDLDLEAGVDQGTTPAAAPKEAVMEPPLRLDEARQLSTDEARTAREQRLARSVRENTPREIEFNRLERERQLAQEHIGELQRRLDRVNLDLLLNPTGPERRQVMAAPNHPTLADGRKNWLVALPGPIAGLLLGLLLTGLRELGGDRMRSVREAEWALGAPVLGGIPTLSARARNAYFGLPDATLAGESTEFA